MGIQVPGKARQVRDPVGGCWVRAQGNKSAIACGSMDIMAIECTPREVKSCAGIGKDRQV